MYHHHSAFLRSINDSIRSSRNQHKQHRAHAAAQRRLVVPWERGGCGRSVAAAATLKEEEQQPTDRRRRASSSPRLRTSAGAPGSSCTYREARGRSHVARLTGRGSKGRANHGGGGGPDGQRQAGQWEADQEPAEEVRERERALAACCLLLAA